MEWRESANQAISSVINQGAGVRHSVDRQMN